MLGKFGCDRGAAILYIHTKVAEVSDDGSLVHTELGDEIGNCRAKYIRSWHWHWHWTNRSPEMFTYGTYNRGLKRR
ncbi:hypothetical protein A7G45_20800 [Mycolicibacterium llatzerense]|nr:hypothetical protein [Mycolicibacterium llatzerense]